ncbi:dysbindin-A-like isoform X1 [Takifugu flavidus]|uniref:dysbindin-A-like isoform X1 n=1 Tax=Takifugu flavidus TaxID=433684 RepID=UPI002544245E|nr:dysbindin-A-like isoform X1 [Takifugu flavidus]
MFENFRERLHMVQHDFTTSFKTLGDKSRDTKTKWQARFDQSHPLHYNAGLDILSRYEESWVPLHKRTKDCAETAETVDGDVVMLSAHVERRRSALTNLQEQLQGLPAFISDLDAITANIAHLEGDFEEIESRLVYLETLCCQCEELSSKQHHINTLEVYQKKKRKEVEVLEAELKSQYAQWTAELEQAVHQKLREQQKIYEEAFKQDVKNYLSTGYLQHREPAESNINVLDQMTVTDVTDQEALDDFLNSPDVGVGSSQSAPDVDATLSESSGSSDAFLLRQDGAGRRRKQREESDEPLVQSDEDDVQPDSSLIGTQGGVG